MAIGVGTAGSAFKRYITKFSTFIGPFINSSSMYDYSKMIFSNNGLDWEYGVTNVPVIMQGKTPSGLYYGYYQNKFLTSTDRSNWTQVGLINSSQNIPLSVSKIVYAENGNYFLALTDNPINSETAIMYSGNGSSWIRFTGIIADTLEYANYGGSDLFVAGSIYSSGDSFKMSFNGVSWSSLNIFSEGHILKRVNNRILAYKNGAYLGYTTTMYDFTPVAVNTYTIPYGRYYGMTYGNGKYILLDYYPPASYDGATITTSTNLSSWTTRAVVGAGLPGNPAYGMSWSNIVYGADQGFRIIPNYGDTIIYSSDGATWNKYPMPDWSAIEYPSLGYYANITHQV